MTKWFKIRFLALLLTILTPLVSFGAAGDFFPNRDGITNASNPTGTGSSIEFNRFTDDTFYGQQKGHIPSNLPYSEAIDFATQNGLTDHIDQRDFVSVKLQKRGVNNVVGRHEHGANDIEVGDKVFVAVYVNNNATQGCGGINPAVDVRAKIDWGLEEGNIIGSILSSNATPSQINDRIDVTSNGALDFTYRSALVIERSNPDGSPDGVVCSGTNTAYQARTVTASVQGDTAQVDLGVVPGGYGHAKFVVFELEAVASSHRPLRVSRNITIAGNTLKNNSVVEAGTEFTYNVTVENVSGETINNVLVRDVLDNNLRFIGGDNGVGFSDGPLVTPGTSPGSPFAVLSFGNIAPGASATLSYTVEVQSTTADGINFCTQGVATGQAPGNIEVTENCPFCTSVQDLSLSFINTIHVCGNGLSEFGRTPDESGLGFKINGNEECDDGNLSDGDTCNNYCRSDSLADGLVITLESIPSSGTVLEGGDTIDYIITVTNNFQRDVTDIVLSNDLPVGVNFVGAIDPTTPGIIVHDNGTVTVNVGDLTPGETQTFRYQVEIDDNAPEGRIRNVITVDSADVVDNDGNTVDLSGTESNPVFHFVVEDATPDCGNGRREDGEQCDDGVKPPVSGDGCDANCQIEDPQNCGIDGDGDGNFVDPGEECDDGPTQSPPVSGDGCNAMCQLELGVCGNGEVEVVPCPSGLVCTSVVMTEECDDGNLIDGDGCSSLCTVEDQGLFIQKEASPNSGATVGRGDVITYMITARNDLDVPLEGVRLIDNLNRNLSFGDVIDEADGQIFVAIADGTNFAEYTVVIESGDFAPGQTKRFEFTAVVNGDAEFGPITNTVRGTGTPNGGNEITGMSNPSVHFVVETVTPECGNDRLEGAEECDDGNREDGDGCDSQCMIEDDVIDPICGEDADGDGDFLDPGEECDDGNETDGDGCSAICEIEPSNFFRAVKTASPVDGTVVSPGDSIEYTIQLTNTSNQVVNNVVLRDVIDPRLDIDGDMNALTLPSGVTLTQSGQVFTLNIGTLPAGATLTFTFPTVVLPGAVGTINNQFTVSGDPEGGTPGDAIGVSNPVFHPVDNGGGSCGIDGDGDGNLIDPGEECDDGNRISGDGCNRFCQNEFDCGNGIEEGTEQCDDGNLINGDGCSDECMDENPGLEITLVSVPVSGATVGRGQSIDFILEARNTGMLPLTGVEATADLDSRYTFVGEQPIGNPPVLSGDVNHNNGTITIDVGALDPGEIKRFKYRITINDDAPLGGPVSHRLQGRGFPPGSTTAITGNSNQVVHFVGDNVTPECGNGRKEGTEECDDGNLVNGDGCDDQCRVEVVVGVCGDGNLGTDEQCDDGNTTSGDGCSATCDVEPNNFFALTKTSTPASGQSVDPGDTISYQLQARNISAQVVNGISVVDLLDDKVALIPSSVNAPANANVEINGQQIRFSLPSLAVGTTVTFSFDVTVRSNASGTVGNNFSVSGNPAGGGGPVTAISTPVFNPIGTGGGSCGIDGDGDGNLLDPGEECDDGNQTDGDGCNRFCQNEDADCGNGEREGAEECDDGNLIDGDGCSSTCTREDNDFDLTKSASPASGTDVVPGDEITYTFVIKNARIEAVQNIVITDTLDVRVEFDRWVDFPQGNRDVTNQVVTIEVGTMDPQAELTYSFVVKVRADAPTGSINNTFTATGDPVGGTPGSATGSSNAVIHTIPDLCGNGTEDAGETCDDGKHCSDRTNGSDGTVCTADADCAGIGDELCLPRSGDGCNASCQLNFCGTNGIVGDGEDATDPLKVALDAGEQCDDGNTTSGDGCSAVCELETTTPNNPGGGGGGGGTGPTLPPIGVCQVNSSTGAAQCVPTSPVRFGDPHYDIYRRCIDLPGSSTARCLIDWANNKNFRICGNQAPGGLPGEIEIPMDRSVTLSNAFVNEQCGVTIPAGSGGPGGGSTRSIDQCQACTQCFRESSLTKKVRNDASWVEEKTIARGDEAEYQLLLRLVPNPAEMAGKRIKNVTVIFRDVSVPADSSGSYTYHRYGIRTSDGSRYDMNVGSTNAGVRSAFHGRLHPESGEPIEWLDLDQDPNGSYHFDPLEFDSAHALVNDLNAGNPAEVEFTYFMGSGLDEQKDLDNIENVAIASVIYDCEEDIVDGTGAVIGTRDVYIPVVINGDGRLSPTTNDHLLYDGTRDFCDEFTNVNLGDMRNSIAAHSNTANVEVIRPFIEASAGGDMGFAIDTNVVSGSKDNFPNARGTNTSGRVFIPPGGDQTHFKFGPDPALIRNDIDKLKDFGLENPEDFLSYLKRNIRPSQPESFLDNASLHQVGDTDIYWSDGELHLKGGDYNMGGQSKTVIVEAEDLKISGDFRVNNGFLAIIVWKGDVIIDPTVEYVEGVIVSRSGIVGGVEKGGSFDGFTIDPGTGNVDPTATTYFSKQKLNVSGAFVGDIYPLLAKRNYIGDQPESSLEPNVEFHFNIAMIDQTPPGLEYFLGEGWKQVSK